MRLFSIMPHYSTVVGKNFRSVKIFGNTFGGQSEEEEDMATYCG